MPFPDDEYISIASNSLIHEELSYDHNLLKVEFQTLFDSITHEQKNIFDRIMMVVQQNKGGVFFVYGYGGTGGRTAHSRIHVPINLNEDSTCYMDPGTDKAQLLEKTRLIIWDEAPMANKHGFQALDSVLRLTKNLRLTKGRPSSDVEETKLFAKWLLDICEGNVGGPNDGVATIDIPDDLLIKDPVDPLSKLFDFVYPDILPNYEKQHYFQDRAILAPTNEIVDEINDNLLKFFPGDEVE
ncbi:uncharacterized protein LOC143572535 [Bidens hawaiensis]|uniref:uncharacterized protein LOC143572535 n=1 Tax=Bidens hawaiensis TaxID=980011 RepID=UPI00404A8FF0